MITASRQKIGELDCVLAVHENSAETIQTQGPDAVVILCHGYGAGGTDLVPCAAEIIGDAGDLNNVLFVFPAAPIELEPTMDSRAWWPLDMEKIQLMMMTGESRDLRKDTPEQLSDCRRMLIQIIDSIRGGLSLEASRIFVGGFSQGAMLATDVALNYPEKLGGLIAWSGSLINESNWSAAAESQTALKVFQSHGLGDPILPFAGAELLRDMLLAHGHFVEFVEFQGEHTIPAAGIEGARELIRSVVPLKK